MKRSFTFSNYNISKELFEKYQNLDEIEKAKLVYAIFFNKHHHVIGHYFRHLYHILSFLEKHETNNAEEKEEIINFSNFIQAQMSIPEMFLLYYNCMSFPKLNSLVIKYKILENLTIEELLRPEHKISKINLKSRKKSLE